jgi:cytidylate kinase-like protein
MGFSDTEAGRPDEATRAVVTIAALYGAGGSVIGPRVAERLGVAFLDRAIPASVAERVGLTEQAVSVVDEGPRSGLERLKSSVARVANATTASGEPVERVEVEERRLRAEIEAFLARAHRSGGVGGVGERLLAGAACPVAVAPCGYADDRLSRLECIGVGVDASDGLAAVSMPLSRWLAPAERGFG